MASNLLNRLLPSVSAPVGGSPVPPQLLRSYLRQQPAYNNNRERAAVVIGQGLAIYDTWVSLKPALFIAGLVGMAVSGTALYKRRSKGSEAWALYGASFLASAATAWATRPGPSAPAGADSHQFDVVAAIDAKRASMHAQNPNFADDVFERVYEMPGVHQELDANPLVKAAIL